MGADPAAAKQRASEVPVDISREDSKIVIETDGGRDTGADYTLRVPTGGSVEVESEAGDVEVSGISGNVTVSAEAGDVTVTDVGGDVEVKAPQRRCHRRRRQHGHRECRISRPASGDVLLEDLILGTLEASVEAGDVTLSGRFSGGGRVSVETGDISPGFLPEDTRDLTLQTRVGSVLREPAEGASNGQGSETEEQQGSVVFRRRTWDTVVNRPKTSGVRCEGSGSIRSASSGGSTRGEERIRPAIFASVILYLDLLLEAVLQMLWLLEFNYALIYAPFLGLVVAIVLAPLLVAGLAITRSVHPRRRHALARRLLASVPLFRLRERDRFRALDPLRPPHRHPIRRLRGHHSSKGDH